MIIFSLLLLLFQLTCDALSSTSLVQRNGRLMTKHRRRIPRQSIIRLQPRGTNESREPVPSYSQSRGGGGERRYKKAEDFHKRRPKKAASDGMVHTIIFENGTMLFSGSSSSLASHMAGLRMSSGGHHSTAIIHVPTSPIRKKSEKKSKKSRQERKEEKRQRSKRHS